jgi:hypothetical protein
VPVPRPIVFLSDFGYRNEWVGICHAVITRIAPSSPIVDLSHGIPPLDVREGALLLLDSLPYLGDESVLLAVVDPGVGRDRDIALETDDGRLLVGPDNGLLSPSWQSVGGIRRAVEITAPDILLQPVSPSFHARDVLAPASAHLSLGLDLAELGPAIDADGLATMTVPAPAVEPGKIECEVLDLNRFGNVLLTVRESHFVEAGLDTADAIAVDATSGNAVAHRVSTYADVEPGDWGLILDPRGWVSVIRGNPANAAEGLGGVGSGDPIWLRAAGS